MLGNYQRIHWNGAGNIKLTVDKKYLNHDVSEILGDPIWNIVKKRQTASGPMFDTINLVSYSTNFSDFIISIGVGRKWWNGKKLKLFWLSSII